MRRIFELASVGLGGKRIVRTLVAENRKPFTSAKGNAGAEMDARNS